MGRFAFTAYFAGLLGAAVGMEIDPADYGFSPAAEPSANAAALQKALEGGNRIVRIAKPGVYRLDRTVLLDSRTTLDCVPGTVFRKVGRYVSILANRGAFDGSTNANITVRGLEIRCGDEDCIEPPDSPVPGLRGQIAFVRVRDVAVEDFACTEYGLVGSCQYCLQFVGFDGVRLENFVIIGGKDGIHFNYGRNFVVRHGWLRTHDDGIALNAGDWPGGCTPLIGSVTDGLVEDVEDLPGGTCNFARVITGVWADWHAGIRLQRNDLVRVGRNIYCVYPMPLEENRDGSCVEYLSNTRPTHTHGVWKSPEGISFQFMQADGNLRADITNVTFRNIRLNARRGINCGWEINKWARLIHPEIPRSDYPVIDIRIEDVEARTEFPVVDGFADARVVFDNVRSVGPLYNARYRDDRNSVIRKGTFYPTDVRLTVRNCRFTERQGADFCFKDPNGRGRLRMEDNELSRPVRLDRTTPDFEVRGRVR